uniref:Uncharacterized protein n=1 Tax=Lepeophtheirus salmonis TaxID=72036 RepID=A0A0K2U2Y5_LEPSM
MSFHSKFTTFQIIYHKKLLRAGRSLSSSSKVRYTRPKNSRRVWSNVKVFCTVSFDCNCVAHQEFLPVDVRSIKILAGSYVPFV